FYDHDKERLVIEQIEARSGPATVLAHIEVDKVRSDPNVTFQVWADDLDCQSIPRAIPDGMLPSIERLEMSEGVMNPRIEGSIRLAKPHSFRMDVEDGFTGECAVTSVYPHDVDALLTDEYTFTFVDYTTIPGGITVGPGSDDWTPLAKMPGYIPASMY